MDSRCSALNTERRLTASSWILHRKHSVSPGRPCPGSPAGIVPPALVATMSRLVMDYLAPSPPPPLEQRLLHHAQLCFDHQELDLAFVHAVTAAEMLIYAGIAQRLIQQSGVSRAEVPAILEQSFGNRVVPDALLLADTELSDLIREVFGRRARFLRGGSRTPLPRQTVEQALRLARILADRDPAERG